MKRRNRDTISGLLFRNTALPIVVLIMVFTAALAVYVSSRQVDEAGAALEQLAGNTSEAIEVALDRLNTISLQISYSYLISDRYRDFLYSTELVERRDYLNDLLELFILIIGPSNEYYRVSLYDFEGNMIGLRTSGGVYARVDVQEQEFYPKVAALKGRKYIAGPRDDNRGVSIISLYRLFYDKNNRPSGIIEVSERTAKVFDAVSRAAEFADVVVTNRANVVVFPEQGSTELEGARLTVIAPVEGNLWSAEVSRPRSDVLGSLRFVAVLIVVLGLSILVAALYATYRIADLVTRPIREIGKELERFSLEPGAEIEPIDNQFEELESIHQSFLAMSRRLGVSVDELILSRSQEMHSRMLALQAQMNPHFLYNSLTQMNIMAKEDGEDELSDMLKRLSDMLRYTSAGNAKSVLLSQELRHCHDYVSMLRVRYGSDLTYRDSIPDSMYTLEVPRLILQPLLENAVRACTCSGPPWMLTSEGTMSGQRWEICVSDNGPGFAPEALCTFHKMQRAYDENRLIPAFSIDGMGMINIHIRLKLFFRGAATMEVRNRESGGTIVTIRGRSDEDGI